MHKPSRTIIKFHFLLLKHFTSPIRYQKWPH